MHNRWTLVDHSAAALLDQAEQAGVAVVNAAIYGGGILAKPGTFICHRGIPCSVSHAHYFAGAPWKC